MSNNSRYEVDLTGRNPREKKQKTQDIPGAEGRRTAATGREDTGYWPNGKPTPNVRPFGAISLEGRNPIEKKQKTQDIPGAEERRTTANAPRHNTRSNIPIGGKRRKGRKSRKVRKSKAKRKKGRKSRKARKTGKNKRRKRGGRRTRRSRRRRNH